MSKRVDDENVIHTEYRFPEDYYRKTLGKYAHRYSDDSLFAFIKLLIPAVVYLLGFYVMYRIMAEDRGIIT